VLARIVRLSRSERERERERGERDRLIDELLNIMKELQIYKNYLGPP
jgi:hypothetical protein